ncbi:MAG: hypothetical protein ACE5M4_11690, partial [Anaerolineales bacterium]
MTVRGAWIALGAVLIIVSLRIDKLATLVDRMDIPRDSASLLWRSAAECLVAAVSTDLGSFSVPLGASDYLRGIHAAVNHHPEAARAALEKAYLHTGNPLAVSLLSELDLEPGSILQPQALELADWSESMRFDVARYYLASAGACYMAGRQDRARRNRELGMELLPPGEEYALGVEINRLIGQTYYQ